MNEIFSLFSGMLCPRLWVPAWVFSPAGFSLVRLPQKAFSLVRLPQFPSPSFPWLVYINHSSHVFFPLGSQIRAAAGTALTVTPPFIPAAPGGLSCSASPLGSFFSEGSSVLFLCWGSQTLSFLSISLLNCLLPAAGQSGLVPWSMCPGAPRSADSCSCPCSGAVPCIWTWTSELSAGMASSWERGRGTLCLPPSCCVSFCSSLSSSHISSRNRTKIGERLNIRVWQPWNKWTKGDCAHAVE